MPSHIGLGAADHRLAIYIANRPLNDHYPLLNYLQPLEQGELAHIVANNTNHWRKVFNVYAKFLQTFSWPEKTANSTTSWQEYREKHLLRGHSQEALLFGPPDLSESKYHVVAGKTYAAELDLPPLTWLDAHFAVNEEARLVVTPYLDYRQLSNERIERLCAILKRFPAL